MKKIIDKIVKSIKSKVDIEPEIGIVVSFGLSEIIDRIEDRVELPFKDIDGLVTLGKDATTCKFYFGTIAGKKVVVMYDRLHYYQGYKPSEVVLPIYALKELGCKVLVNSSAVGAINKRIKVGDIVLFSDHLNFSNRNPLIGVDCEPYGFRFFDMTNAYNYDLLNQAYSVGKNLGIGLKKGVYIEFMGPNGETPAEIHMAQIMGADVVGFHVANEVVAARYCGMEVIGVSLVTNHASAFSRSKIRYEDIKYNRQVASGYFGEYLYSLIKSL